MALVPLHHRSCRTVCEPLASGLLTAAIQAQIASPSSRGTVDIRSDKLTCIRNITDPRALALVLEQAEARLERELHPDPYRRTFLAALLPLLLRIRSGAQIPLLVAIESAHGPAGVIG